MPFNRNKAETTVVMGSSLITRLEYDEESRVLRVHMISGVYDYFGVDKQLYLNFVHAPSKGAYFNAFIRHFPNERASNG